MVGDLLFGFDIFISYAHGVSREYANALFDALTSLDYRVFLDKAELPAGERLTASLKAALRRSHSVVVIGTRAARKSKFVSLEVDECIRLNRKLIPIDVDAALSQDTWLGTEEVVAIPETAANHDAGTPSDEVVTAVSRSLTFTRRNKVRRRVVSGAVAVLALLAVVVAWTSYNWSLSLTKNQRDRIDAELREDELRPKTAVDLSRSALLNSLLERARFASYDAVIPEITSRLSKVPMKNVREEILPQREGRAHMLLDPTETRMVLFGATQLEIYSLGENRLEQQWAYPRSGRLLWCEYDPTTERLLYEIQYLDWTPPDGMDVESFDIYPQGSESGIFAVDMSVGSVEDLGLSREYRSGTVHVPPDDDDAISALVAEPTGTSRDNVINRHRDQSHEDEGDASSARIRMRLLATSGDAGLYEWAAIMSEVVGVSRHFAMHPLFVGGDGESEVLPTPRSYPLTSRTDVRITQSPPYLDPVYEPAALDARQRVCLLRQWFVRFPRYGSPTVSKISLDYDLVAGVAISGDTKSLVVRFKDGSIGLYNVAQDRLLHRFPAVADMLSIVVGRDGSSIYLLRADGRVERWDFAAFGPDGWAAS